MPGYRCRDVPRTYCPHMHGMHTDLRSGATVGAPVSIVRRASSASVDSSIDAAGQFGPGSGADRTFGWAYRESLLRIALSVASALSVVPGFATDGRARHGIPPKQVRYPADCRFTSGCSPPVDPLRGSTATTQLPSIAGLRPTQMWLSTSRTKRPHGRTHPVGQRAPRRLKKINPYQRLVSTRAAPHFAGLFFANRSVPAMLSTATPPANLDALLRAACLRAWRCACPAPRVWLRSRTRPVA